jgi:hypothetical protein
VSRTKKLLPKDGLEKIRDLSSKGHSEKDIARALGMSASTWTRIKDENPEAQDALDAGRSIEHLALYGKLYEKAMGGDIVALLFLLKCRHGYRETLDITQSNAVQIIFAIPGALDPAEYAKLISQPRAPPT